ncbi:MAG: helix-turn-helix domain-containing protein [Prevotella sp.]|nr:helix-turn-helix domain-containing protein [Prevotella sp.]
MVYMNKTFACITTFMLLTLPCHGQLSFQQAINKADSLYANMYFREAYDVYVSLLDDREVKQDAEKRMLLLNALCDVCDLVEQKGNQMAYLQQLLDLSQQQGNKYYHSLALLMTGKRLFYEGDKQKGLDYVEQAVAMMAETDRPDTDHLIHSQLNVLITLCNAAKEWQKALDACERNVRVTREGTRWDDSRLHQQDKRVALSKLALTAIRMGLTAKADSAYAQWLAVPYEGYDHRAYFIVDYLRERGRYEEATKIYEELISQIRTDGDTLGRMMQVAKWGLAEVRQRMGDYHRAADLYVEVLEIGDTLQARQARNNAQQLAALYETQEKERQIHKRELWINVLVMVLGALLLIIGGMVFYFRKIRQKNRLMRQAVDEMVDYREAMLLTSDSKSNPTSDDSREGDADLRLFMRLDRMIDEQQLYLNPNLNRDELCTLIGVDKNRLSGILKQYSSEMNLKAYINRKRILHALQQMRRHPEWTILAIAQSSGITNTATFNRIFRQNFGMSPTEYIKST